MFKPFIFDHPERRISTAILLPAGSSWYVQGVHAEVVLQLCDICVREVHLRRLRRKPEQIRDRVGVSQEVQGKVQGLGALRPEMQERICERPQGMPNLPLCGPL